jgi:hypothetical protein
MGMAHAPARLGFGKATPYDLAPFVGPFIPGGGLLLQIGDVAYMTIPQALS